MQDMGVFDFARTGPMSFEDANALVGVLNRITQKHSKIVNTLIAQLEALSSDDRLKTSEIEAQVSREIEEWNAKVHKLGAIPKGLWLVDFDSGEGYYCWKFPETKIDFWHDYKSGFSNRIPIAKSPHANCASTDQRTSW